MYTYVSSVSDCTYFQIADVCKKSVFCIQNMTHWLEEGSREGAQPHQTPLHLHYIRDTVCTTQHHAQIFLSLKASNSVKKFNMIIQWITEMGKTICVATLLKYLCCTFLVAPLKFSKFSTLHSSDWSVLTVDVSLLVR